MMKVRAVGLLITITAACVPQQGQGGMGGGQGGGGGGGGGLSGTWVAQGGAQIVLSENAGQVTGTAAYGGQSGTLQGTVRGDQIVGTYSTQAGKQGQFVASADGGGGLQFSFDGGQAIAFVRADGGAQAAAQPAMKPTVGDEKIPAPKASAASGPVHKVDHEGWQVHTPAKWKYAVKGNRVLFGSDTEAGFIVVWFAPNVTYEQMESNAATGAAQLGMSLAGPPIGDKMKGGKALVTELLGTAPDGTKMRGRAIGVAGPGGTVAVLGITTPEKFDTLRGRVDSLARSVSFFKPKRSPAMKILAGAWWHYHGTNTGYGNNSASSSYERTIVLCTDGSFQDSDESNISVSAETKTAEGSTDAWGNPVDKIYGSSGSNRADSGSGRWVAVGDDMNGSLELQFKNGNVERHNYVFKKRGGGDIELDGRWYGFDPKKYQGCSDSQ